MRHKHHYKYSNQRARYVAIYSSGRTVVKSFKFHGHKRLTYEEKAGIIENAFWMADYAPRFVRVLRKGERFNPKREIYKK